ncbi:uncharacterized protein LOC126749349 isoform X1 [Anthonomus grandis grandis]|uniref:uncharacterized protein LOC126749349 isoform X1 n=1 Tax=Anthonomus grandis grandis TaxID=2921223 RepID=UPI0021654693|nr:uncharacterized protein LOC126749349 isoform X1 [Anthonomus grandis grandis]
MEDKHSKRINQYLQHLTEERDYLTDNVYRIIKHATNQVESLTKTQTPSSEKEKLLTFLTKSLALFSELNSTILKYLECEGIPENSKPPQENLLETSGHNIQEVEDYYKGFDVIKGMPVATEEGPKVPNTQAQNGYYFQKPLNDSTLKAICNTIIKSTQEKSMATRVKPTSLIQEECDSVSTVSTSTYCHPLSQLAPPTEIPEEYDNKDLKKVRENMMYLKEKLGLEDLNQLSLQYNKHFQEARYHYEEQVKESVEQAKDIKTDNILINNAFKVDRDNGGVEQASVVPEQVLNNELPVKSTGAVKKQMGAQKDLIEFSSDSPSSERENSNKVSSWLTSNETEVISSEQPHRTTKSALEKLAQNKRHDRNAEIWDKIRNDVPELNFVPATKVIKNVLSSSSSERSFNNKSHKKSAKTRTSLYTLNPMELPSIGAICVFSHIVSPAEFYLQVCNDTNSFNEDMIRHKLDSKFSKSESPFKTKQMARESLGQFCRGYVLKEQSWFRLRVLNWKIDCSSDEVEVQSVDYGFKCVTSYKYLRELTRDLAEVPMLCIKCHFPLLYPPGSTYSNRLHYWPDNTKEELEEIVNLHSGTDSLADVIFFKIVFAQLDGDSLGVDLEDYAGKHRDTLGRFLVDMRLAQEILDEYEDNPELGEFLDDLDRLEEHHADNQNEYLFGYDAKDEVRVCRFTRKDGTCYKGKNCKLEHVILKDGYTTDKLAVFYTPINDLILPVKGDLIQVLPTAYLDPCTYLVQLVRNPIKVCDASNMIMDKEMGTLIRAMNHPKLIMKYELFKILPAMGEFILAFQPSTNQWVRAMVRMLNVNGDESLLEVYSVDFGDEFQVTKKDIRQMPEQFIHLPCQIVQIYLENFQRRNNFDEKKWKRFFNKHISYKLFFAHIRSNERPLKVQLETLKGVDIGPTLVKEQLAEPRTMDSYLSDDPLNKKNVPSYFYLDME